MAELVYDNSGRLLFTKEMKEEYTILMPQMLPIHFGMFKGEEREVLLRKMEEYCQKQTGMSLRNYAQQFREEPEQRQGPVMKL